MGAWGKLSLAVAVAGRALGETVSFTNIDPIATQSLQQQYRFFVRDNGPRPHTLEIDLRPDHGDDKANLEALILPEKELWDTIDQHHFCGLSGERGQLVLKKGSPNVIRYQIAKGGQAATFDLKGGSGAYALMLSNCGNVDSKVIGKVGLKSLHGYLPAHDLPKRTLYGVLALVYFAMAVAWGIPATNWWNQLFVVQKHIALVTVVGVAECLAYFVLYELENVSGEFHWVCFLLAAFPSVYKVLLCFRALIAPALSDDLSGDEEGCSHMILSVVLGLYAVFEFNFRISQAYRLNRAMPARDVAMHAAPAVATATALFVWTQVALCRQVSSLKGRSEHNHAKLVCRSMALCTVAAAGAAAVTLAALLDPTGEEITAWGEHHWIFADGLFQLFFLLVLGGAMAVWFPRESIQGYAYQPQEQNGGGDAIGAAHMWNPDDDDDVEVELQREGRAE